MLKAGSDVAVQPRHKGNDRMTRIYDARILIAFKMEFVTLTSSKSSHSPSDSKDRRSDFSAWFWGCHVIACTARGLFRV